MLKINFVPLTAVQCIPSRSLLAGLALTGWILSMGSLRAESNVTVPAGCVTFNFPGGTIAAPKLTMFSIPLRGVATDAPWRSAGEITGLTATTLTSTGAGWPAGNLALAATPYFVRIKNGPARGNTFLITANTADTLTLPAGTDLTALGLQTSGANQSKFEIFPADTLSSFFGPGTADGANGTILGAANANDADRIRIHDGVGWRDYYYNTTNNRWQDSTDKSNLVLPPHWGITYSRKAASAVKLAVLGTVPDTDTVVKVPNTGLTYFAMQFPVDMTLLDTGIHLKPGFVPNTGSAALADKVYFWNGSAWGYYTYLSSVSQWRDPFSSTNRNTFNIPAGTPIWFQKAANSSGFQVWNFPMPYNLGSL